MENEETQVEETTEPTPPVKVSDNQAEIEKLTSESAKKDAENLKLQQAVTRQSNAREKAEKARERDREEFATQFASFEDTQAIMMDRLAELSGDTTDTPSKTIAQDELRKKREQAPKPPVDSEVVKFLSYLDSEGLNMKDSIVMESVQDRDPDEALVYLKDKRKEDSTSEMIKIAGDMAEKKVQQILKELGVAKPEGSPSAPSQDDDAFMLDYSKGKSDDHKKAQEILKKMK